MGNNRCPSQNDERPLFCSLSGTVILVAIVYTYRVDIVSLKLQVLVYDILPLEKGAGKRCLECKSPSLSFVFNYIHQ